MIYFVYDMEAGKSWAFDSEYEAHNKLLRRKKYWIKLGYVPEVDSDSNVYIYRVKEDAYLNTKEME